MNKKFFYVALCAIATGMFSSCIKPDQVELNENVGVVEIDETFTASSSFLQAKWLGQYSGYDENQKSNTNIRRELVLNSDGTYTNKIFGLLVSGSSDNKDYVVFEKESGTYRYNGVNSVTYYVQKDSLINYKTETLEGYTKKKYYDYDVQSYSEKVEFTKKDGSHAWVTKDLYLSNLKGKDLDLVFVMSK